MIGRPSQYRPDEHPAAAEALAAKGATVAEIASAFGVSSSTVNRWAEEHPAFAVTLKAGREASVDRVERALLERAVGYSWNSEKLITVSDGGGGGSHVERHPIKEHVPPDPAAIKFFLTNRRRKEWAERQQLTGGDDGPLRIEVIRRSDAPGTLRPQTMTEEQP